MSNPMPTRDGWAEYQRLVLSELERHNEMIDRVNSNLREIQVALEIQKQDKERVARVETRLEKVEAAIDKIDRGRDIETAIKKYRKWIFGILFTILTAVIVPFVKFIFFPGIG